MPGKKVFITLCVLLLSVFGYSQQAAQPQEIVTSKEIWSSGPHNAFTDLIEYKGDIYCSFREGSGHVPGSNGVGRILKSRDGNTWEDFAYIEAQGIDLRDQKISVMPDGRMLCLMGGSVYDTTQKPSKLLGMYPHVSFLEKKGKFTTPQKAVIANEGHNWIWRLTWFKGVGYGVNYDAKKISLVTTTDGKAFKEVKSFDVDGAPNESTIRFDRNGKMYILIRREEGDKMGVLASAKAPYTQFTFQPLKFRLGGPDFIFSPDQKKLIMGTRLYYPGGAKTGVLVTDLNGAVLKTVVLESGGDCSYPGLLIKNNQLWVSYYSSHRGKTNIYFTKIDLKNLLKL